MVICDACPLSLSHSIPLLDYTLATIIFLPWKKKKEGQGVSESELANVRALSLTNLGTLPPSLPTYNNHSIHEFEASIYIEKATFGLARTHAHTHARSSDQRYHRMRKEPRGWPLHISLSPSIEKRLFDSFSA